MLTDTSTDPALGDGFALHARGVAENAAGHPARAARAFRRGLATLDGVPASTPGVDALTARLFLGLALSESEIGGVAQGLPYLGDAQRRADASGELPVQALVHGQHGLMLLRSGRLDDALGELDAGAALLDHLDLVDQCRILLNRGGLSLLRGDLVQARTDLSRCARLAARGGLVSVECKARHNLGYLEFLGGNLPTALRLIDEARHIGPDVIPGVSQLDRARVLLEAGLVHDADDALADAGLIFARDRLPQDLAEVELARAECALLAGDPAAARRLAVRARARFRRRGNQTWQGRADLTILQADVAAGRTGRAVEAAGRQLAAGTDAQSRIAAFVTAEALLDEGRVDDARALANSVGSAKPSDPIAARLHTGYLRARLARASGDATSAARHVRASLRQLATYQAQFGSIDMQTASAIHGRRLTELGVAIAIDDGRRAAAAVFAASERGRAVSSRLPSLRPPADAPTAELLAELRQAVEGIRATPGDASLRRKRRDLEREIKARSWTLAGSGQVQRQAGLTETRAAVANHDSTMVSFVRAGGRLHAVVLGAGPVELRSLGAADEIEAHVRRVRADLDVLAHARLPAGMRVAARASLERAVHTLDGVLLAPLRVGSTRLVVVPTGLLGALPWGALPSCRGRPVTIAPSATAWLAALGAGEPRRPSVVALAGPDLERAAHEAASVASEWPGGAAVAGEAARRDTLSDAMSRATIVHVAAHGRHDTDNPLFSSISLADGPLFAYELEGSAIQAEHVVLSACELGLATMRPGDEALGLTSVLLHLGTRSVVAGVARVADETAAEVMVRYHKGLAAGRDSAAALADALQTDETSPAPFVCFGAEWTAG